MTNVPQPGPSYDFTNESQFRAAIQQFISQPAASSSGLNQFIDATAAKYGIKNDYTVDSNVGAQAALTDGATAGKIVYFGGLQVGTSVGLTCNGPGVLFDSVGHGKDGSNPYCPGFYPSGTGYVTITFTGIPICTRFGVYGAAVNSAAANGCTGPVVNGVDFGKSDGSSNILLALIENVRVYNLNGFGIRYTKNYDCLIGTQSVELCGNATFAGFIAADGSDSSNMTHLLRLQVESALYKAINMSGNILMWNIDHIHSEAAYASGSYDTWYFALNRGTIKSGTFSATIGTASVAVLHLSPADSDFYDLLVEGAVMVKVDSSSGTAVNNFIGLEIQGTLSIGIQVGYDPKFFQFSGCNIATLTNSSTHSAATFTNCTIGEGNSLCANTTLNNTDVTCASAVAHSTTGTLRMNGSTLHANVIYTNASPIRMCGSRITGYIKNGDGGNRDILMDSGSTIGSEFASGDGGVPTGGAHNVGDYHKNPVPVETGTALSKYLIEGWECTTNATPGNWLQRRTLTGN